jgi:hypothetical protein
VLVLLTGIGSYFRQGVVAACLLLLPVLVTVLVVYSRGHLLFPRFMFGSAGFLMLFAVRGGFVSAGACLPFLSRRQVLLIGSLVALAGAMLVPGAWKPKQDFVGVAEFMVQHRAPDDPVICIMGMRFILQEYLGVECVSVQSVAELVQIEKQHERVWMIYGMPTQFEARFPQIWKRIRKPGDYVKVKEFAGTLSGGDIVVLLKQTPREEVSPAD